ncbi:MAG: hypothetical protein A2Y53_04935 [Chloroflexi bacterium RBG_16_47_49]|nr:MAG: hypothetical protein A2Y53_04935 [Chloroflexi bacterium RBG_16_47_49]
MAKSAHIDVLDGCGLVIDANANLMTACNAQPTTRTEAVTTFALADVAMAGADFTPAMDGTGRMLTVSAKSAVPIDVTDTAIYIALVDATRLLYVTTCTSQLLTQGGTVDFPSFNICKIPQPT